MIGGTVRESRFRQVTGGDFAPQELKSTLNLPWPKRPFLLTPFGAVIKIRGSMLTYLWIAIGGALGSVARFWCSSVFTRHLGDSFPWGTLVVNVTGSFAIGILAAIAAPGGRWLPGAREFLMVGVCGGYTTFSAFSLQTLNLLERRQWVAAGANVTLSCVLCLLAVWLGHTGAKALLTGPR